MYVLLFCECSRFAPLELNFIEYSCPIAEAAYRHTLTESVINIVIELSLYRGYLRRRCQTIFAARNL